MGVTQLWQILAPVEQHLPLSSLEGQTLAVDLSIWVCENQCVKQMQGVVAKPYLRNLFFRISHLTQLGVKLVFVIEGSAPELKWDTMIKRQQSRFPGRQGKQPPQRPAGKQTRRNFNAWLKECCELLEILGIPYIQSKGEAEALCALLNAAGLVDGCLTNDGDAFLYGATTVYRNFTMNSKDPHVEMFRACDMESKLGIDRGGLIALGLLIGCDFVPKGVPGIGVANAVRLLQSLQGQDILIRLQSWSMMAERDCVDQSETLARRKAIQVPDFPQVKVIDEFLVAKDRCPSRLPQWKRPVPATLQEFALVKLEWPIEYTMEKVLPLVTLWDMLDLIQSKNPSVHQHLKPHRIVKTRIRQGEPCFEVEWVKPVTDTVNDGSYYVTVEGQDLFTKCYAEIANAFITQGMEAKKKPKAKKKKKKVATTSAPPSLDNLSFQFEKISLRQVTSQLEETVDVLHPSFSEYDETALTTKAKQPRHLTLSPNAKISSMKGDHAQHRKPGVIPFSLSETVTSSKSRKKSDEKLVRDADEETFVPLSQRVKLRMQNKHYSNKENENSEKKPGEPVSLNVLKSTGGDLSNMSSLLEDIQNLSIKEQGKFRHKMKGKSALSLNSDCSPCVIRSSEVGPGNMAARNLLTTRNIHKMSSPAVTTCCSPMTYMKRTENFGDSFEIQRSPYYIENPVAAANRTSGTNKIDISSPGFFSRLETNCEPEQIDERSAAAKLMDKIESGISKVGNSCGIDVDHLPTSQRTAPTTNGGSDKLDVDSLMAILNGSGKTVATPQPQHLTNQKTCTPMNQSISGLDSTSHGQFGDFQIQHSLLNSLCSSLVQALTPKGVSMTREEYDRLVTTLNEIESDENVEAGIDDKNENVSLPNDVCNIDYSELEKASSGFKHLNQKLLLKPIQIDDEDVMLKLSKSARKKLRRRERKREQELDDLAIMQNISQSKGKANSLNHRHLPKRNSLKSTSSEHKAEQRVNMKHARKQMSKRKTKPVNDNNSNDTNSNVKTCRELSHSTKSKVPRVSIADLSRVSNQTQSSDLNHIDLNTTDNRSETVQENEPKVKKRRKRKKVNKASPFMDLSADDSILDDNKLEEYLKKALENNQRKPSDSKIVKASPFMDFSADDTLLELEGLTCKITGEELDSELDSKLKVVNLKQKKGLSKLKMTDEYSAKIAPVLSMNNMVVTSHSNVIEEAKCKSCGKQEMMEDTENNDAMNTDNGYVANHATDIDTDHHGSGYTTDHLRHKSITEHEAGDVNEYFDTKNVIGNENENMNDHLENVGVNGKVENGNVKCHLKNGHMNGYAHSGYMNGYEINENGHLENGNMHGHLENGNMHGHLENGNMHGHLENGNMHGHLENVNSYNEYENVNGYCENVIGYDENVNGHLKNGNVNNQLENGNMPDHLQNGVNGYLENEHANGYVENGREHLENGKSPIEDNGLTILDSCQTRIVQQSTTGNLDIIAMLDIEEHADEKCLNGIGMKTNIVNTHENTKNETDTFVGDYESHVEQIKSDNEVDCSSNNAGDLERNENGRDVAETDLVELEGKCSETFGDNIFVLCNGNVKNYICESDQSLRHKKFNIQCSGTASGAKQQSMLQAQLQANHTGSIDELHASQEITTVDNCDVENETPSKYSVDDKGHVRLDMLDGMTSVNGTFSSCSDEKTKLTNLNWTGHNIDNFGKFSELGNNHSNNTNYCDEVFQSPACLADRLKLKLRKTSTRNVLDTFTNGK